MIVTAYEPNSLFIDGGTVLNNNKELHIYGLTKRLNAYAYSDDIEVINENFYTSNSNKKYDFIYVHRSLHRDCNSNLTIEQKIKISDNNLSGMWLYFEDDSINDYVYNITLIDNNGNKYFYHEFDGYIPNIVYMGFGRITDSKNMEMNLVIISKSISSKLSHTPKVGIIQSSPIIVAT